MKKKVKFGKIISIVILIIILILFMFPIYYLFTTALKQKLLAFAIPPVWFFKPTLENFKTVLSKASFSMGLLNSMIAAGVSTILAIALGAPAGFYLTRAKWAKRESVANWILSTRMAPPIVVIIPFFLIITRLGMFDKIYSLVIIYLVFNLPLVVLIIRSFFDDIPVEFDEAGMVDGLSYPGIFWYIALPLCRQGLVATGILTFLLTWNEFLFALILTGRVARTMPVLITGYIQQTQGLLWSEMAAASVISCSPLSFSYFLSKGTLRAV